MAEKSITLSLSETEIVALREALFAQQELLQKLYNELDVEREAASSAASEALSMILRLQGEKAAIKMEANQYKRLAEEKMCHSEEALAIFEDLIYQKEMEIASLEYQLQAYRYRLLSLGFTDIGVCETKFPENLLQRSESLVGEVAVERNLRRNSLPPIPFKVSYQKKGSVQRERSRSPDFVTMTEEQSRSCEVDIQIPDLEKKSEDNSVGDINSYWEEIKKLDERVKEFSDFKGTKCKSFTLGSTKGCLARAKTVQFEHPPISQDIKTSTSVDDVFEVQCVPESEIGNEAPFKQRLGETKSVSQFASFKPYGEDEIDLTKKLFSNKQQEKTFSRDFESNSSVQHLSKTSEIYQERGEEELKLLKAIQVQLNSIQSEIRNMKNRKCSRSDDLPLISLSEAMLHFWL